MQSNENTLSKQIKEMQAKLEEMSKDIIKLTVINEHQFTERQVNSEKLDKLESEFSTAKGAISLLKGLITMFGASAIAFCTWIVTTNNDQQKEIYAIQQKLYIHESKINDTVLDIEKLGESQK